MHFGCHPRKTLLATTLFLAFSAANASFLEQSGTPPAATVVMKTYGVDVATRVGLKAVIPSGWQLFSHRSVELPESLSWKVDESWVSVLNNFAKTNDIAVLVDWDKRAVYFRSTAVALQEQEKRQMIASAASTPLPSLKADEPSARSGPSAEATPGSEPSPASTGMALKLFNVVTKPANAPVTAVALQTEASASLTAPSASTVATPSSPRTGVAVVALAASAAPVAAVAEPLKPIVSLYPVAPAVSTTEVTPSKAIAVHPAALPVAAAPGQVAPADSRPLAPSYGRTALAMASMPPAAPVLIATAGPSSAATSTPVALATATAPAVQILAVTPVPIAPAAPSLTVRPVAVTPVAPVIAVAPTVVVPVAPLNVVVPVAANLPLVLAVASPYTEQALAAEPTAGESFNREAVDRVIYGAATKHGYTVSWEASDVRFPGPVTLLGADMGEDMNLVLRALGGRRAPVSIDVYRLSNVVRVRNAGGTAEVAFSQLPFQGAIREKSVSTFSVNVRPNAVQGPTLVAAPAVAPVAAPHSTALVAPTLVAAPAVASVAAPHSPDLVAAIVPELLARPALAIPEPYRRDTAVPTVQKLDAAVPATETAKFWPAAPLVVLRVERGQALRGAIEALLEPGWSLKWEVNGDMEANTALEVAGASLTAVLNKVLPRLALSADIYNPSKLVVVRPADAALDK